MTAQQYLTVFFEEKQIQHETFEITDNSGITHFLDTQVVIESILSTCEAEQTQIADILRQIDFRNGDVNHFLKHLANGLVKSFTQA